MAYTKIKPVKHHLQRCLDYTSNPKKTEKFSADDLNRLLSYTQNQNKTEHQLYVTGFRCNPATAYRRMYRTKKRWNQPMDEGDILAYHIIQSFSPGEATPDQVHKIGCEFARRFLADRFECTVSTHLDKGHLHNHIVVNSVSYADGKMFRNNFDTYYHGIRQVSDELCRENRLSVIETDGKGKSYDEWLSGQAGKPTIRGMVRKDVEQAIAAADSFDGFILELQNMGYTVKYGPRVEHIAVRHKDAQRNIRIDRLDPRFSETALREYYRQLHRMPTEMQQEYRQENAPAKPKWQPTELQPTVRRARYLGKLPRRYPKVSGFMACYYHYCALLRKAYHGKSTKRCYFLLREDFLLFSRYQQQTKFLWENHIETMDELLAYKENAEVQIQQLARQRKVLYRQKREPERAAREEKIKSLTQQMKALRHEVYICSDIETDAAEVQEKLRQAELAAQEERNEVKQDEQRGEAADQMVREALQVTEVAIKLSALGIKNTLALSLAYAKENPKVKGKTSLDRLLREGKELKIIALQSKDVGQFKELAKQYGVLFAVIKDKAQNEKVDVMFKAEDVAKLNRIYEQLGYAIPKVTTADRKKDPTRRQSGDSLLTRGKNPLDIDPRPSVRATIMALKNVAQKAEQAQEKVQDITAKEER